MREVIVDYIRNIYYIEPISNYNDVNHITCVEISFFT